MNVELGVVVLIVALALLVVLIRRMIERWLRAAAGFAAAWKFGFRRAGRLASMELG
jgi:hypothetical protein